MGIQDYVVLIDKFEEDTTLRGLCFPCCACRHRSNSDSEPPCNACDHNMNNDNT